MTTLYKIVVDNIDTWNIYNYNTLEPVTLSNVHPVKHKLFTNDVFFTSSADTITIYHSALRTTDNIPAVLILHGGKTYGYNSTKKKLLYKCIPDDRRLPTFLVPYDIKTLGFSKVLVNLYVTIKYTDWINEYPTATINQTIGSVNELPCFYEYQLYCKSLNASIQNFTRVTNKAISEHSLNNHETNIEKYDELITNICNKHVIEDRTDWNTFTIDPLTSLDYDDGFSIKKLNDNQILLSVYIANVSIWMDFLHLWSSFSQRISTIYLPDRKRPMLPSILSDCLCSLQQHKRRFAFTMDVIIDANTYQIIDISYKNTLIKVYKNYGYDDPLLLNDPHYLLLFHTVKGLSTINKYVGIRDSHDVVGYAMILMNYYCAKELLKNNNGIFRSMSISSQVVIPDDVPNDVITFIKLWNSSCAQYVETSCLNDDLLHISNGLSHDVLQMDAYVHITSPIRRLVDLLNMIKLQQNLSLIIFENNDALDFYNKWINQLEYINTTMRTIKKIQNDCTMLDACYNNPDMINATYDGYCFDKIIRNDGLFHYIVYLPAIKLTSRITSCVNITNYGKKQFKLFLFNDEDRFKRKIRLHMI